MEKQKILIATKTYPSISKKYHEVVCTAGLLLNDDEVPQQWIRIYPVRFRGLDFDKRYPRWSIINAKIERNLKDPRDESFRIDDSSIEVVRKLRTDNAWAEIKSFILEFQSRSTKELISQGKSLGIIKPLEIHKVYCEKDKDEWTPNQQAISAQIGLFEPPSNLEKIPYRFGYTFTDQDGIKHSYSISDWEIKQLYRNCRDKSKGITQDEKQEEAIEKVQQKLEKFRVDNDLYFIVGNQKTHPKTFMIIGLVYPPMVKLEQLSFF